MKLITIKENWPIRVAKHKVLYRKAFILNELDKIILSFLYLHNDIIGFNELGSILGFAVSDNRDEQVYFDIAEAEIFSSLLDTLLTYHLISTHKNGDDVLMISTTHWGIEARLSGVKHLFYEGIIGLNEHYLLYDWESCDSLFEFSKHGIFSEVGNSKEVTPYLIDLEEQKKNIFLKRALLNIDKNQEENKNIEVQWVNEAILHYEELVSNLSLSLMKWDAVHSIQIVLNASPSPELDGIILQASNSNLYFNWLLLLRYQVYLRDTKVIQADEIVQYSPQVNWEMIQRDSRIVWDNDWFQLMSSDNVTSTSVWREIIQNCPDEILLLNIEAYVDYWDWSRLSMKAEIAYIVKSINRFPWDLDICLERIEPNDLEQLLTTIKDPSAIQDWVKVTKRVSFEFIESNIRLLPFDLHIIGSSGEIQSGQIILNNPQLNWDWSLISRQYPIIYLILYIDTLSPYIDIVAVVHRILTSEMEFTMSFNDLRFGQYLIDNIRRTDFKIGKDQRVILNPETFRFLSDNDLLFWGNEQVPGIEAN